LICVNVFAGRHVLKKSCVRESERGPRRSRKRASVGSRESEEAAMTKTNMVMAVALVGLAFSIVPARSDEYPTLNVAPLCHGITDQSTLQEGLRSVTFDECLKAEQSDRETMIKEWPTFSSDDRRHCVAEATMGGESSYTDLLTCLEMARDVRALNKPAENQKQSGDQQQTGDQTQTGDQPQQNNAVHQRKHPKHKPSA
jgi:hypothetical protein